MGVSTVYNVKIFGSGTRLYVTKNHQSIQKPKLTAYPVSNPELNGKTTLLCLAREMFPDIVKISWTTVDGRGQKVVVQNGPEEQLEQIDEGQTISMIIIDKVMANANKYSCSVKHERGIQEVDIPNEKQSEAPPATKVAPTCPPRNYNQDPATLEVADDSFQSMFSLNLASLAYTVMIVKSLVYTCGLAVLLQLRNTGK